MSGFQVRDGDRDDYDATHDEVEAKVLAAIERSDGTDVAERNYLSAAEILRLPQVQEIVAAFNNARFLDQEKINAWIHGTLEELQALDMNDSINELEIRRVIGKNVSKFFDAAKEDFTMNHDINSLKKDLEEFFFDAVTKPLPALLFQDTTALNKKERTHLDSRAIHSHGQHVFDFYYLVFGNSSLHSEKTETKEQNFGYLQPLLSQLEGNIEAIVQKAFTTLLS